MKAHRSVFHRSVVQILSRAPSQPSQPSSKKPPVKKTVLRHRIPWNEPGYYDPEKIELEVRRVFDICHGCRRCFNLCDTFPQMFNLIDNSPSGELDTVPSSKFKDPIDACTMCDMCFIVKCPYTPPHEFNLDFPHLILRYRASQGENGKNNLEASKELSPKPKDEKEQLSICEGGMWMAASHSKRKKGEADAGVDRKLDMKGEGFMSKQLAMTDRNGKLAALAPFMVNWMTNITNPLGRTILEKIAGIHRNAELPKYVSNNDTLISSWKHQSIPINTAAPAFDKKKKAIVLTSCLGNYNHPDIGLAVSKVLSHCGVSHEFINAACCGMPSLEQGDIAQVARSAIKTSELLGSYLDQGYDIISFIPSCSLMIKSEWPLLLPNNDKVLKLAAQTKDISEYLVQLRETAGLPEISSPTSVKIHMHVPCHSRAQNVGNKGAALLQGISNLTVNVVDRCSGHGGTWGCRANNFEKALKLGKPAVSKKESSDHLCSECPLAGTHLTQIVKESQGEEVAVSHPVQIMAALYGLAKWPDGKYQMINE